MNPVVTLAANDPEDVTPIYWDILETFDDGESIQNLPGGDVGPEADDVGGSGCHQTTVLPSPPRSGVLSGL